MSKRLFIWSVRLFLLFLPLQTHYIFVESTLRGHSWHFTEISMYAVDALLLVSIFLSFFARNSWRPASSKGYIGAIAVVALLGVTSLIHHEHAYNWYLLLRYLAGAILMLLLMRVPDKLKSLYTYFVLGIFVAAVFGIWQFIAQYIPGSALFGIAEQIPDVAGVSVLTSSIGRFLRSYGTFPHPNIFAGYLAVGLLVILTLALRRQHHPHASEKNRKGIFMRYGWLVIAFPLLASLVFSFSRSAWMGVACAVFALMVVSFKRRRRDDAMIWTTFFASLFTFLVILSAIIYPLVAARIQVSESVERVSIQDRQRAFADAGEMLKANWATGIGLGETTHYIAETIDPKRHWWEVQPPHNMFVLLAIEASIFTSFVFLTYLFALAWDALKKIKKTFHHEFPFAGTSIALIVLLFVIGLFDHYLVTLPPGLYLLFTALGLALRGIEEDRS